ncbi:hypothetical protein KHQ08_06500 [Pseudochrobactrum algeriensis]|uniref:hypothetical protein n=1 Tax=Pseudochrobactrum TaxID=354349 RepID=UPI000E277E9F|nr:MULTISPECIES: hypothetical protein [Pseudochrobactrum]MBX8784871.1 hypothetical protein [Ochrobactrum sp. GRS2]MBX8813476.1 hypothetical protein [Ochrobactrum sp. MR34]QVQ37673.1 hypothetical protein KHQ08_06500 [Pseudochrobactrum algeriensis]QVQ40893.1 hypothetical protein KHQ07_04800 [Pseudochrobactrum algeriensis]QVQ44817.1 hypothetical protein KHQ09_06765 [Pseudochrobactrum algeriensis]
MKKIFSASKKDQLTEQYRAIGPAFLAAALRSAPRSHRDEKRLHVSYLPSDKALRPQQAAK